MGEWTIVIQGHGIHDNGRDDDADAICRRFVDELAKSQRFSSRTSLRVAAVRYRSQRRSTEMTVTPVAGSGGGNFAGAIRAAAPKPPGITAVGGQGRPAASKHVVHGDGSSGVDDGAHGTHDYAQLHVQVLDHLHAHGAKLAQHDERLDRLEAGQNLKLGSPKH